MIDVGFDAGLIFTSTFSLAPHSVSRRGADRVRLGGRWLLKARPSQASAELPRPALPLRGKHDSDIQPQTERQRRIRQRPGKRVQDTSDFNSPANIRCLRSASCTQLTSATLMIKRNDDVCLLGHRNLSTVTFKQAERVNTLFMRWDRRELQRLKTGRSKSLIARK